MVGSFRFILVVAALVLFATCAGAAPFQYSNQVGMYTTPDGRGATGTDVMFTPVEVYLVLTKPVDEVNGGVPQAGCLGFECTLTFNPAPAGDLMVLDAVLPPSSLDYGSNKDINRGYLDFVVGIDLAHPAPVVDEAVQLVAFTFLNLSPVVTAVTLGPYGPSSIPGEMVFLGEDPYLLLTMYSKGGSPYAPVFLFNGEAVATERESFGSIKALYR